MPASRQPPPRAGVRNRLLRAMSAEDFALLQPHLEPAQMTKGEVVVRPNVPFESVYFPEDGLASVISSAEGRRMEVGIFGRDGICSVAAVLGADRVMDEIQVQGSGTWLRMDVAEFRRALAASSSLQALLMRFVHVYLLTVSRTAVSNGRYEVAERLARWLLMAHDRIDGDELPLTHEFLSLMLGTRRPSLTIAIHTLEGAGLIKATRGLIQVRDRAKLEAAAGEVYGYPEQEYERMIGPFRQPGARL